MNRGRLDRIKRLLGQARRSQQKARDLETLARMVGRRQDRRGKEPTWVHDELPVHPLSIPHHGGRDLRPGTRNSILNVLEDDVIAWEERLGPEDDEGLEDDSEGD
jgi:hypothetical protein